MNCNGCRLFVDGKCTDTQDYVNRLTGEDMCKYNSLAISREEYEEQKGGEG